MAAPLRKVSLDYHQTLRRVRFRVTSDVPLRLHRDNPVNPPHIPEIPSDRNTLSFHTVPSSAVSAEVHDDYYLSFLSWRSYPPGLYTAIAHDGPLRTRIQCFWSELDEFWWHLRHARHLLFGWLATLYHLILLVVGYTFYKQSTNFVTSVVLLTRRMRATSLRYVVMVWLLPVLDKIRNSALEAVGTEGLSKDTGASPVRSDSEGKGVAVGIPIPVDHAQVRNGGKSTNIFHSERVLPTSLWSHPAPTTNDFSTPTRTYPPPTHYHTSAASIASLKARLGELDRTVNALEKSLSGRSL